jgi:hypothetical protein
MNKTIFLLGAGASVEAGLPTSNHLTEKICQGVDSYHQYDCVKRLLAFSLGILLQELGERGEIPSTQKISAEKLYDFIDALEKRSELPIGSLLKNISPILDRIEKDATINSDGRFYGINKGIQLGNNLGKLVRLKTKSNIHQNTFTLEVDFSQVREIENKITRYVKQSILSHSELVSSKIIYDLTKSYIIDTVLDSLNSVKSSAYLQPILKLRPEAIITLNYDDLLEGEASSIQVKIDTGLDVWNSKKMIFANKAIPLIKLHGCKNFAFSVREDYSCNFDNIVNIKMNTDENKNQHVDHKLQSKYRAILFGGGDSKLKTIGPFHDLFKEFKRFLTKANCCVIVGYAFGDEHVNQVLEAWFHESDNMLIVIDTSARLSDGFYEVAGHSANSHNLVSRRNSPPGYVAEPESYSQTLLRTRVVHIKKTASEGLLLLESLFAEIENIKKSKLTNTDNEADCVNTVVEMSDNPRSSISRTDDF